MTTGDNAAAPDNGGPVAAGPGGAAPDSGGPGQTLFRFVRHWSRRWHRSDPALAERGRDVLVTEAVHALHAHGPVTVNDVAAELGINQSGASRMIGDAAARGLLRTAPVPGDGRRRAVDVTPDGAALLDAAHRWQERTFATLTAGWTDAERAEFHRGMARLLAASAHLDAEHEAPRPVPGRQPPGR